MGFHTFRANTISTYIIKWLLGVEMVVFNSSGHIFQGVDEGVKVSSVPHTTVVSGMHCVEQLQQLGPFSLPPLQVTKSTHIFHHFMEQSDVESLQNLIKKDITNNQSHCRSIFTL